MGDAHTAERASIRRQFGAVVGAKQVTARQAGGAILMVGGGEPQLRRRVRAVESMLKEALPLLAPPPGNGGGMWISTLGSLGLHMK